MSLHIQVPLLESPSPRHGTVLSVSGFNGVFGTLGYTAIATSPTYSDINFPAINTNTGQITLWLRSPDVPTGSFDTLFKFGSASTDLAVVQRNNQSGKDTLAISNMRFDTGLKNGGQQYEYPHNTKFDEFNLISIQWKPTPDGLRITFYVNANVLATYDAEGATNLADVVNKFSIREDSIKGYKYQDFRVYTHVLRQYEYDALLALGPNVSSCYVFYDKSDKIYKYFDFEHQKWEDITALNLTIDHISKYALSDYNKIAEIPADMLNGMSLVSYSLGEEIALNIDANKTVITKDKRLDLRNIRIITDLTFNEIKSNETDPSSFKFAILNLKTDEVMILDKRNRWIPIPITDVPEKGFTLEQFNSLAVRGLLRSFMDAQKGENSFSIIIVASNENGSDSVLNSLDMLYYKLGYWTKMKNRPRILFRNESLDFYLVEPGQYKINY